MTKFLTKLITEKTTILKLSSNSDISKEEKISILDLDSFLKECYINYMYYYNNKCFFF